MSDVRACGVLSAKSSFSSIKITRREPGDFDVQIDVIYCGICHSDLHQARNEWQSVMPTVYPCVPGHEIVGRVSAVGSKVSRAKVGQIVGVGCLVDSDGDCPQCLAHLEQFCPNATFTYNSPDKYSGGVTFGGYSERIVVNERFALKVPDGLELSGVAPLLCAGITTFSPMRRWGVTMGKRVGVVGLGGLGHMGVKFARALGAHTVVFTTSKSKVEDAFRLGAHEVVLSSDDTQMKNMAGSMDFILDTIAAPHDLNRYLALLGLYGNMTLVGAPDTPLPISSFGLLFGNRTLSGSLIGGLAETQEMLDFCGKHKIVSDVEVISVSQIDHAYERLMKSDVKYRFSIDMETIRNSGNAAR